MCLVRDIGYGIPYGCYHYLDTPLFVFKKKKRKCRQGRGE